MRISSASSKILFQSSTIYCSASRIEVFNIIEQFQILTSTPNRLRSLKIDCHNHQPASKSSYKPSSKIQTEKYKSRHRRQSLPPLRRHCSNNPPSTVAPCELNLQDHRSFRNPHIKTTMASLPKICLPTSIFQTTTSSYQPPSRLRTPKSNTTTHTQIPSKQS